jgi:hypothetical protein
MICAYCGKKTKGTDGYCEHCFGYIRKCEKTPAPQAVQPAPAPTKICGVCGNTVAADSKYCPHCHAEIGWTSPSVPHTEQNEPKKNGIAIAAIICSFLFPLLGFIFGIVGASRAKTLGKGKGLSIAAILLSLVISVAYVGAAVYFFWPYVSALLTEFGLL